LAPARVDLSDVYLKLERAEHHIDALRVGVEAFQTRNPPPFGFRAEQTPLGDDGVQYDLFAVVREEPPRKFGLIVGDAVHNIRAALDYLVYALAPPDVRRKRETKFPIYLEQRDFDDRSPSMLEGLMPAERELIERVQPFIAAEVPREDPLAVLNRLANRDKHHLLVTMIASVDEAESWVSSTNAEIRFTHLARGPVHEGTRIVSFTATPRDPTLGMDVHPQSGLQIQVDETGITSYVSNAVQLLEMIHHHVRHSIIGMWFQHGQMPPTYAEIQARMVGDSGS
jgi:hypothetical protein